MRAFLLAFLLLGTCLAFVAGSPLRTCQVGSRKSGNAPCTWSADYLVVGTGAGGAPVLRKLTDNNRFSAIGFEAGKNLVTDPTVATGIGMYNIFSSLNVYNFQMKTVYDTYMGKENDIAIGRMFGGSTSHNGMQYIRPTTQFCPILEQWGGADWSCSAIQQGFKQLENFTVSNPASSRGTNGPVNVRVPATGPTTGSNSIAWRLANWTALASGIPMTADYNDVSNPANAFGSFPRYQMFQNPDGTRESSATAFLPTNVLNADGTAVGRRPLRVLFQATVTRIIFQNHVAKGVEFMFHGQQYIAYAKKEVIIAASIFSSQLLQLSGVGPAALLQANGIPVVYNNPNVGEHLINHNSLTLPFTANPDHLDGVINFDYDALYAGGAFLPRWDADGALTNHSLLNDPREFQLIWFTSGFQGLFVGPIQPKSQGYERIQSDDPLQVPLHFENTFSDADELDKLANFLFHFVQNTLFAYLHSQDPLYNIGWTQWNSVDDTKTYIQASIGKTLHYASHTRMAPSAATGVVDSRGRVFGVQNLRVTGAAALPVLPDATPAALSMLFGWRLADFILADA